MNYIIYDFLKMFIISNLIFFTYYKAADRKDIDFSGVILNGLISIVVSVIFAFASVYFGAIISLIVSIYILGVIRCIVLKKFNRYSMSAIYLSAGIAFIIYILAIIATRDYNNTFAYNICGRPLMFGLNIRFINYNISFGF